MPKVSLILAFSALLCCVMSQNLEDPYYKLRMKEQAERISNMLRESLLTTTKLVETTTEAMETTTKPQKSTMKAMEMTTKSYESTTNSDNLTNLENPPRTSKSCTKKGIPCLASIDKCCSGSTCVLMALTNSLGVCKPNNYKQIFLQAVVNAKEKIPLSYLDLLKFVKTQIS